MVKSTPMSPPEMQKKGAAIDLQTTPGKLIAFLIAIIASTLLLWVVDLSSLAYARSSVQTITKDSIPSIVAAQYIREGLFRMDGDTVANYLELTHGERALYDVDADRVGLAKYLVTAAQNITYGDAEGTPIRTLVGRLPYYAELTSPALEGKGNWRALRLIKASNVLHTELIPAAEAVDKVNRDHLTESYGESMGGLKLRGFAELAFGVLLVGVLVAAQLAIAKMTHRRINPFLAIATLLALVIALSNYGLVNVLTKLMKTAKEDAFDSVGFLSEAKADGSDARALALYGLIPEGRAASWPACKTELANLSTGSDAEMANPYPEGSQPNYKGLLANELRNITFPGEREEANTELQNFKTFQDDVIALQSTQNTGGETAAVQEAFSGPTAIDPAYTNFEKSVSSTEDINQ